MAVACWRKCDVAPVSATRELAILFGWADTILFRGNICSILDVVVCPNCHLRASARRILT